MGEKAAREMNVEFVEQGGSQDKICAACKYLYRKTESVGGAVTNSATFCAVDNSRVGYEQFFAGFCDHWRKAEEMSTSRKDSCPKASRCYFGEECPRDFEPDSIYSCFERHRPNNSIAQYSKADLIAIINYACENSPEAKAAIEKARKNVKTIRANALGKGL